MKQSTAVELINYERLKNFARRFPRADDVAVADAAADDDDGNVTEGGTFGPNGKQARKCYAIKSLNLWDLILNTNLILPFISPNRSQADQTMMQGYTCKIEKKNSWSLGSYSGKKG